MIRSHAIAPIVLALVTLCLTPRAGAEEWKPQQGPLMTRWAKDVKPDSPLPEYPRPQMVRKDWQNLNGLWDYAIRPRTEGKPEKWDGQILVPFAAESALSGVKKSVGTENKLWYHRKFTVPPAWFGKKILLHFGAVDWQTTVWMNGQELGSHQGGYDPFTFELGRTITSPVEMELVVAVWDPTDSGEQPRGKQVAKPHGIWYTPVTGIWQTVWIEPVPDTYFRSLKITPDVDSETIKVEAEIGGEVKDFFSFSVDDRDGTAAGVGTTAEVIAARPSTQTQTLKIESPKLWSPESPFLYGLSIRIGNDSVESYFAMRKVSLDRDDKGILRLMLNNKPIFHVGPLDQGWWPDGLYTAPTDDALKYDIEMTKKVGFNMARKHTKVEPDRWYYWADKLGLMVWQDMPTGYPTEKPYAKWDPIGTHDGTEGTRTPENRAIYDTELKAMIDTLRNHPAIVMWVPHNEGWGQFDTVRISNWIKEYDPTRLVNCASGGNDFPVGDVKDLHNYPGPAAPKPDGKRAIVLGEFGGLGLPVEGHTWQGKDNWGYRTYQNANDLAEAYGNLYLRLRPLMDEPGLAAAIYTQTTDVEGEVNGLMTYDREVLKIPEAKLVEIHALLNQPPAIIKPLVPDARTQSSEWKYTFEKPADGWEKPSFDDSKWKTGPGGFGTANTPGAKIGTIWDTPTIWIRRSFELPAGVTMQNPHLSIHHDEDAEVFLNGVSATKVKRHTTEYVEQPISPEARATLAPGKNTIAASCKQTTGGQYIDVGIVEIIPGAAKAEQK